ncbi:MAG TPA: efflux RND transporter periplasmic adaptor subunit [Planctomycetota bacterium]|nr:efflux RND transporter periplasmic adaptor subunit [Planctomycetota bacterium]
MSAAARVSRRRTSRRARLLAWAAAAALATAGCGGDAAASAGAAGQPPSGEELLPVSVARAERKDVPLQLRSVGRVESPASVVLRPQVEGPIVEVRFTEGDEVTAGDVLLRLDDRPFQAELRAAEANLDADTAMARDALTTLQQLQRVGDLMSEREVQRAQASSDAAAAKVVADQAEVDLARLRLEYCSIRAPITGRTGTLEVRVGSVVKENDTPLLTIRQLAPIRAAFSVPEQQLGEIQAEQARAPLAVEVQAASGPPATGRLTFIDNAVDPTTGTVRLMATFDNADRALWPGQFVEVQLTLSVEAGAVVVPAPAVQPGQAGPFVFVVTEQGTVEQRPVTVSRTAGGESLIAEGLQGGETVVTAGQLRLSPGVRVSVAP